MFTCPRCTERLSRCQPKGGVYWRCPRCEGRTATVAMLRNAVDPLLVTHLWESARRSKQEDTSPCPVCNGHMKTVSMATSSEGLQLDVCLRCHVVWFDPGEYDSMPPPGSNLGLDESSLPLDARLALIRMNVEALDPRPDMKLDGEPPPEGWKAIPAFFGMPVKHDSPAETQQQWGTWCLSGAVVLIGLLGLLASTQIFHDFGFIPSQAARFGGLTLLTSLFLHGTLPHLATSAYYLMTFGDDVENLLGTVKFLILVFASAIAGNLLHALIYANSSMPLLGAGAGVSGLLTAYGLRFPRARIGFILRLPIVVYRWVNLPAWLYILFWIVLQTIGAMRTVEGITQVSWAAHLGGALTGFLGGLALTGLPASSAPDGEPS